MDDIRTQPPTAIVFDRRFALGRGRRSEATLLHSGVLLWMAGIAILTVPMVTLIDISVARWFSGDPFPREIVSMLELMLFFSHGVGIFLILVGIFMLAPRSRWHVPRLVALATGAGAVATIVKMFVLRPRPSVLNLDIATYDLAMWWVFDWELEYVATFATSTRAFPSGSTATATALMVGLWVVLPRGRWLFVAMCLGTFFQRIYCGAHFLSDVVGGIAIGLVWAYACFHPRLLGSIFDKLEPESRVRRRRDSAGSPGETAVTESVGKIAA